MDISYAFDETGQAPANRVFNEAHTLTSANGFNYQFIVPRMAPFFTYNLKVIHVATDRELALGIDYTLTHKFKLGTEQLGTSLYGSITFLDKNLNGEVQVTYQTLGGDFILDEELALIMLTSDLIGHRLVNWEDIAQTPATFPPIHHQHQQDNFMGLDEVVTALNAIRDYVSGITHPDHHHTFAAIDGLQEVLDTKVPRVGALSYLPTPSHQYPTGHTGPLTLELPRVTSETRVTLMMLVQDADQSFTLYVDGDLLPHTVVTEGQVITNVHAYGSPNIPINNIQFAYNLDGRAVIYIGETGDVWTKPQIAVINALSSTEAAEEVSGVYKFGTALTGFGDQTLIYRSATLRDIENSGSASTAAIDALEQQIDQDLNDLLTNLTATIDGNKQALELADQNLSDRIDALVLVDQGIITRVDALESADTGLSNRIGLLETEDQGINTRLDNLELEDQGIKGRLDTLEASDSAVVAQVNTNTGQIASLVTADSLITQKNTEQDDRLRKVRLNTILGETVFDII
ncbi:hypothetical protein [Endozoicomonas sp. ONNA1]|uniref:hypothetical protein n=1 Tax=Endozoicomonas sp. ONNA1 TaxID=2828740 RepID=UPI0021482145|nr:hypothetical protein [Endozoicomonas sp. ONNA1]